MNYERFYPHINNQIKVNVFDVMDHYSANRHSFDGMHFTAQFKKLFDECRPLLDISDDDLAKAVNIVLTLEQRRMNSYSQGNEHIEDYFPTNVKPWESYL